MKESKPPYRVPTMAEVQAIPLCGLRVASTFSGGGGSSLGYRMAGLKVAYASEFVESARETYAANFPDTFLDPRDIRTVKGSEILSAIGLKDGELDVFDGSPPCSAFSTAGKREKGWGVSKSYSDDKKQVVDDLFFEYARLVGEVRPRAFVAENVSGLVKGAAKGYFLEILAALKAKGYRVKSRLLDAQWLGVPQARRRLIFVGFREDLGVDPAFPDPFGYRYSIREALEWAGTGVVDVVHDTSGLWSSGDVTDRPSPTITVGTNSMNSHHFKVREMAEEAANIEKYAIGEEWKKLREGETSEKYFNLVRPFGNQPSPTVTATGGTLGAAAVTHPSEPRKFTISELKAVCSFPPDFVLSGSYQQQWERCGRAVPPLMMRAIAGAVRDALLRLDGKL